MTMQVHLYFLQFSLLVCLSPTLQLEPLDLQLVICYHTVPIVSFFLGSLPNERRSREYCIEKGFVASHIAGILKGYMTPLYHCEARDLEINS